MDKNPLLYIPPHVPEAQKRTITFKEDGEYHFIYIYNIVLIVVKDHYCKLYMVDRFKPECSSSLLITSSLDKLHSLLGKYFAKPNRSQIFNRIYLSKVDGDGVVHLYYPGNLPPVKSSQENYDALIEELITPII